MICKQWKYLEQKNCNSLERNLSRISCPRWIASQHFAALNAWSPNDPWASIARCQGWHLVPRTKISDSGQLKHQETQTWDILGYQELPTTSFKWMEMVISNHFSMVMVCFIIQLKQPSINGYFIFQVAIYTYCMMFFFLWIIVSCAIQVTAPCKAWVLPQAWQEIPWSFSARFIMKCYNQNMLRISSKPQNLLVG